MAKLTYNDNGIIFNNVTSTNTSGGTFIGKEKIFNTLDNGVDQETLSEYGLVPILQSLQIDWNGATLSYVNQPGVLDASNQVNTTGQLLALMNNLQSRLSA